MNGVGFCHQRPERQPDTAYFRQIVSLVCVLFEPDYLSASRSMNWRTFSASEMPGALLAIGCGSWPQKSWLFSKPSYVIYRIGVESCVRHSRRGTVNCQRLLAVNRLDCWKHSLTRRAGHDFRLAALANRRHHETDSFSCFSSGIRSIKPKT